MQLWLMMMKRALQTIDSCSRYIFPYSPVVNTTDSRSYSQEHSHKVTIYSPISAA